MNEKDENALDTGMPHLDLSQIPGDLPPNWTTGDPP